MATETETLTGQVALITGGGSGLGLGCAIALARDGATVLLAGRDPDRLRTGADEVRVQVGASASVDTIRCDVTDEAQVEAACGRAAELGAFTMVMANAGIGTAGPIHQLDLDDWNAVMATNVTGAMLTIKHAAPHLAATARSSTTRTGDTSIVTVSSLAGVRTHRYMTSYTVSKAALDMLTQQAADELGRVGIRVNSVRPGLVPTDISAPLVDIPEVKADYLVQMPLARLGTAEEVAELVRFLLGPRSAWITGTCISIDGGHHLRRGPDLTGPMTFLLGEDATP